MTAPIAIENVRPEINCGRYPAKTIEGQDFYVSAEIFKSGHDLVYAVLKYRKKGKRRWNIIPMDSNPNDIFTAKFKTDGIGFYEYTIEAWKDSYGSLLKDIQSWYNAGENVEEDLKVIMEIIRYSYNNSRGDDKKFLRSSINEFKKLNVDKKIEMLKDQNFSAIVKKYQKKPEKTGYCKNLGLISDPVYGGYASWYELFPRSLGNDGRSGTLRDLINHLGYVKSMNFNVIYLTPIHPIGITNRRGKNGSRTASPGDPGSPWAIGNSSGGHYSINPELGTMDDFEELVKSAEKLGIKIAMDIAFQCSPDHPYVHDHPEWFYHRLDGSIRYAENPPKKYYDIYPLNFEIKNKKALWNEMRNIIIYWINHGIRIFRIDNPHTKPLDFWEWLLNEIKSRYPDVVFLAEAFTKENLMFELSKRGFTMSYTYFTWRVTPEEIISYFSELNSEPLNYFFRPMLFTNTPDILGKDLWKGRNEFIIRAVLASTLSPLWGIYSGFELCENDHLGDTEEYLNSEKYEIKHRDFDSPGNIKDIISKLNIIREENPALKTHGNIYFCETTNNSILAYARYSQDFKNIVLVILNMDTDNVQSGYVRVPLGTLKINNYIYDAVDVLNNNKYKWNGEYNYVRLIPGKRQAHIMVIKC